MSLASSASGGVAAVAGNTSGLYRASDGSRTGSDCKSDTLDFYDGYYWIRPNVACTLSVVLAKDHPGVPAGTAVSVALLQGVASEFLVRRIKVTGNSGTLASDLILLGPVSDI